jgi:hypothetical protein
LDFLCFGCGRFEDPLYLAIRGSPNGFDDFLQSPTIAESRFLAKSNLNRQQPPEFA